MGIDRVGGAAPSLDLLGNALCVGWGKDTELGTVAEVVGQMVDQMSLIFRFHIKFAYFIQWGRLF